MDTPSTKVAEYSATEAALAEMRKLFAGKTYDVTTKDGLAEAKKDRYGLRTLRTKLEAKRVEIKAPVLHQARLIDSEAARLTKEIAALEDPIDAKITAQEKVEAEKRAAAEKAAQERVAGIEKRIADLERLPATLVGKPVQELAAALMALGADRPGDWAQEFAPKAGQIHAEVVTRVGAMHDAAVAAAAEAKRLAEERAALERQQAEHRAAEEKAKAEREASERQAKEYAERAAAALSEITGIRQQSIIAQIGRAGVRVGGTIACIEETLAETEAWPVDAEYFGIYAAAAVKAKAETVAQIKDLLAAARARAYQEAALKAERDRLDADRRAKEEAEHQAKLAKEREAEALARAEREKQAAEEERQRQERLAAEAREREARDAREAVEREERRKEQERLDARGMLQKFVEVYGHLPEFGFIVVAVKTYLDKNPVKKAA